MQETLDLIRISKSSVASKLILKGFKPSYVIEYISDLELKKQRKILPTLHSVQKEFDICNSLQISIISFFHELYPQDLKQIKDPPMILYLKGNVNLLQNPKFAIIGARSATFESLEIAKKISYELSEFGFTITSGFAFGVDTASCLGAINFGTIQVLGSGVNKIYPKENTKLYQQVLDSQGLFVSELPPNFPVKPENFPLRNRIISGISKGVLLVQGGLKNGSSGSLLTAKIALNQEKDLFAIPGHPLDTRFTGGNDLLKNGNAIFTTSSSDIVDMIGYHVKSKNELFTFKKRNIGNEVLTVKLPKLEINEDICLKIKNILSSSPLTLEGISEYINEDLTQTQISLIELELVGEVKRSRKGFILNLT